ncbi:potassium transporter TrkH [Nonlabens sp. MIC269]|uniref:TrkH family potassium uptake protein n=1 Tax=Nonlabens TaxID=363408 RepID=UPI0007217B2B|nr:potassium transporter TrkG [Nonlabens sp. MIC269]ALM20165.1 potassium transporter TrkH [Nonlabens sp. MIC269]
MGHFFKTLNQKYQRFKLGLSPQRNLFYGFFTYIITGCLLLCLPWFQKQDVSFLDNLFIATSAVSTTGLVTVSVFDSYNFFGQFVVMSLFQLGGIGYLTFTTFMLLSTTRKITHWHKRLLSCEFTLPTTIRIKDFLKSVILFTVIMELIGAILFFIAFYHDGMPFWEAVWNAIFHSISAFCTAGFSLFNSGFTEYVDDGFINFIISFLAIAGSLGFIVVTDLVLYLKDKTHKLSFTTKIIFIGFAFLLSTGFMFMYFLEPSVTALMGSERIYAAFFQTMSAMTTVGFNTVDYGIFSLPIVLVTIFLMYVGASPSGTAGGMKITTLTAVFAIMKSRLQGAREITFLGRKIPFERLYIATSSFIFYTSLIFLFTLLLSFTEDFSFEKILFEVSSALGTVGLSMGITGDLTAWGKAILIVLMFIGRLGVLTFGLAIWSKQKHQKQVAVLEDDLAV